MTKKTFPYGPWPIAALALGIALAGASAVSAETVRLKGPHEAKVDAKQVVEKLEKAGYQNVHDLEWDDGFWEVEATSPKGLPVDIVVDPTSGEIVHEEVD